MLDVQIYGKVEKIANEAPIPVLHYQKEVKQLGGCGNVLMNLASLGCEKLFLVSMIGDDIHGKEIEKIIEKESVITSYLLKDASYCTTVKTRGFSENKIVFRYDIEKRASPKEADILAVKEQITRILEEEKIDSIVLSDYNKGFLTKEVAQHTIIKANAYGIPTLVDPKIDYTKYIGCTLFKPNIKEIRDNFGIEYSYETLEKTHKEILEKVRCKETLLTLSEKGMSLFSESLGMIHEKTDSKEVHDVTGAGDVVLSVFAYYYNYLEKQRLVKLATWIGTESVKHMGTYVTNINDILEAYKTIRNTKLITLENACKLRGSSIATNGCFDILHQGHVELFNFCKKEKKENESVIVVLNSDASIKRLKGESRPIHSVDARVAVLNSLESIDWIVVFEEDSPYEVYKGLRPRIIVKGGDYTADTVIGGEFSEEVKIFTTIEGRSTTNIIRAVSGG